MPKNKHPVWVNFECKTKKGNSGKWAVCKKCKKDMQGIPSRMMKHSKVCTGRNTETISDPESETNSRDSNDEEVILISNKQETGNKYEFGVIFLFILSENLRSTSNFL